MSYAFFSAQLSVDMLGGLFGSGHGAWAPSTFTAKLGSSFGGGLTVSTVYSVTATIPNDSAHWTSVPAAGPGLTDIPGYWTNLQWIRFSALTSGDLTAWDHFGTSILLQDGSGTTLVAQAIYGVGINWPFAGEAIGIGPGNLQFVVR